MKCILACLALVATAAPWARAQAPRYSVPGVIAGDQNGFAVRGVGDLDADGHDDFAVGAPFADLDGFVDNGRLRIYSGRTGLRLRQFRGDRDRDELGFWVAGLGDVDADGHADVAVTVRVGRFRYPGEVWITSGRTGRILYRLYGQGNAYDYYGESVAGLGDVDGDGFADFAVSGRGEDGAFTNSGRVLVYSGRTRAVLHTLSGSSANEDFGVVVAGPGDVDGDGYGDLLVAAMRADQPGRSDCGVVRMFSGRTGALLWSVFGAVASGQFGAAADAAGDVDGDGVPDVIVGAHRTNQETGLCRVLSGRDGALLHAFDGTVAGAQFGYAVAGAGDVDGDGRADLLIGEPGHDGAAGADCGRVFLRSGADGRILFQREGASAGARLGAAVSGGFDLDADGYADFGVGAPFARIAGEDVGLAEIYSLGGSGTPGRVRYRGAGCRGSDGRQPRIEIAGRPVLGSAYTAILRGARPRAAAVLNLGLRWDQPLDPLAPGCIALAYPLGGLPVRADDDGLARLTPFATIPVNPAFVGVEIHHQWLCVDPANNALGISASDDGVTFLGR